MLGDSLTTRIYAPGSTSREFSARGTDLCACRRDVLRLPEKIGAACLEFIFGPLSENPDRLGGALRGQWIGLRSARRGGYRVIYRVNDEQQAIEIVHIDHRNDVLSLTRK